MTDRSDRAGGDGVLREELTKLITRHVGAWIKDSNPALQLVPVAAGQDIRDLVDEILALASGNAGERAEAKWRLLPSEPTEAMIEAGVKDHRHEQSYAGAEETYLAMVAAAPAPPQPAPDAPCCKRSNYPEGCDWPACTSKCEWRVQPAPDAVPKGDNISDLIRRLRQHDGHLGNLVEEAADALEGLCGGQRTPVVSSHKCSTPGD